MSRIVVVGMNCIIYNFIVICAIFFFLISYHYELFIHICILIFLFENVTKRRLRVEVEPVGAIYGRTKSTRSYQCGPFVSLKVNSYPGDTTCFGSIGIEKPVDKWLAPLSLAHLFK